MSTQDNSSEEVKIHDLSDISLDDERDNDESHDIRIEQEEQNEFLDEIVVESESEIVVESESEIIVESEAEIVVVESWQRNERSFLLLFVVLLVSLNLEKENK